MVDLIFILVLGLFLACILAGPVGWRHQRTSSVAGAWLFSLLVLIPLLWLALLWIPPAGPAIAGVYWFAPLAVGILVVLLLAATAPPPRKRLRKGEEPKPGEDQLSAAPAAAVFVDIMFWLFFLGAIALLIAGLVA